MEIVIKNTQNKPTATDQPMRWSIMAACILHSGRWRIVKSICRRDSSLCPCSATMMVMFTPRWAEAASKSNTRGWRFSQACGGNHNASFGCDEVIMKDSFKISGTMDCISLWIREKAFISDRNWVTDTFVTLDALAIHGVAYRQPQVKIAAVGKISNQWIILV